MSGLVVRPHRRPQVALRRRAARRRAVPGAERRPRSAVGAGVRVAVPGRVLRDASGSSPFWVLPTLTLTSSAAAVAIGVINMCGNMAGAIGSPVVGDDEGRRAAATAACAGVPRRVLRRSARCSWRWSACRDRVPPESVNDVTRRELPPAEELLRLYRQMVLIRRCEEQLARSHQRGLVHGACHTYVGQEAIAVGVCAPPAAGRRRLQHAPRARPRAGQGRAAAAS